MPSGIPVKIAPDVLELWREGGPRSGWRRRAACRGMDPNLFFADSGTTSAEYALGACKTCPVRADCLLSALADEDRDHREGIRGGVMPGERDTLTRKFYRTLGRPSRERWAGA